MDHTTTPCTEARKRHTARRVRLGTVCALCAVLPMPGVAGARARHPFSARWEIGFAGGIVAPSDPEIVETWMWRGSPFGRSRVVTRTPRDQIHDPIRTPSFTGRTGNGTYSGHLRVEKTYLETTATHSLARFEGTGRFEGGTGAYHGASGTVARVHGDIDCFPDGTCDGHLSVKGWIAW